MIMKQRRESGFTMVELLVVIVMAAIVLALVAPNLINLRARARDDERKKDLRNYSNALNNYFNDRGSFPGPDNFAVEAALTPEYLQDGVPKGPQDEEYVYITTDNCTTAAGDCDTFTLSAALENANDIDVDKNGNMVIRDVTSTQDIAPQAEAAE